MASTAIMPPDGGTGYLPRVAKGAVVNLIGVFIRMVLIYGYTFMLARILDVDQLGAYFLMFSIISILGLVSGVGLDVGIVRYVSLYVGEGRYQAARRMLIAGVILSLPLATIATVSIVIAAPALSPVFFEGSDFAADGLRIFAIAVPFWVVARLFNATTQGIHKMQYQVYSRDVGEQVSKVGLSAIAAATGIGLTGVIWANVASIILAAALSLAFVVIAFPRGGREAGSIFANARILTGYSLPLALSNIFGVLLLWADMLLLGYLGTASDVGFYGTALRVSTLSATILMAFGTVFAPVIADLFNKARTPELQLLFKTVTRWIMMFSLPIFLMIAVFPNAIMKLFGEEFTAGAGALVLLGIGQLINSATGPVGMMVLMSGRSRLELLNMSTALIVNVAGCFLLIPRYGLSGAAFSNLLAAGTVNGLRMIESWIFLRMHAYDRSYLKPLIAGGVAVATTGALQWAGMRQTSVNFPIMVAIMLATYGLVTFALGLSEQDRTVLKLIKARLRKSEKA